MEIKNELFKIGLTEEQYEECMELIAKKKNGSIDIDWREICENYNLPIHPETLKKANGTVFGGAFVSEYLANKNRVDEKLNNSGKYTYKAETSINKDGTYSSNKLIKMNDKQAKDPDYILKAHGFNCESWKLVSARNNIRQVISKQDGVTTLYASFINVKPIEEKELSFSKINQFFDNLDRKYSLPRIKEN